MIIFNKNFLDKKDMGILNLFIEMGIGKNLAETLIYLSKIEEEKKKKGMKYFVNIYDEEEEEMEEQFDDFFFDVIRYPPDSNPPPDNNQKSLIPHFMILNPQIR